jgi:hypothetical protein
MEMETSARWPGRIVVIVAVVAAVACSWLPSIQTLANEQVDAGLKRALLSFAVAKTLNAAISVAQGTEVAVQPVGVGLTLTLGQALDPLNDLVEQFASLMLMASIAFGVQKALLAMGAHWAISLAVTLVAVTWAALHFHDRAPHWLSRLLIVLVMIRFAIPVITIGSDWAFRAFLADNYEQARNSLDIASASASKPVATVPEQNKDGNWWDKLKQKAAGLDVGVKLAELQQAVDKASDHIIELMVVFVMQTIVVPLVLLWALLKVAGGVFQARPGSRTERAA